MYIIIKIKYILSCLPLQVDPLTAVELKRQADLERQGKSGFHVVFANTLRKGTIFIPRSHVVKVKGFVRPKGTVDSTHEQRLILLGSYGYVAI